MTYGKYYFNILGCGSLGEEFASDFVDSLDESELITEGTAHKQNHRKVKNPHHLQ